MGNFEIAPESFDLAGLIDFCCDVVKLKAQDKTISLTAPARRNWKKSSPTSAPASRFCSYRVQCGEIHAGRRQRLGGRKARRRLC